MRSDDHSGRKRGSGLIVAGRALAVAILLFGTMIPVMTLKPQQSRAQDCCECIAAATIVLTEYILEQHLATREHITLEFEFNREWMINVFFIENVLRAMMMMTEQLTAVAMQQVEMIGSLFDAKHQLETQRLFQQLQAQAHKDYHPSEGMCDFGTNVRSLAASERKGDFTAIALSRRSIDRQVGSGDTVGAEGPGRDIDSRIQQFKNTFCNVHDNNDGLNLMCGGSGPAARQNRDIDFTRTVYAPWTLDMDLSVDGAAITPEETDVFALSANLYSHDVFGRIPSSYLGILDNQDELLDLRSVVAKRSVAENSFNSIVGMKSEGTGASAEFMAAVLSELAVPAAEIIPLLGETPSYYAQMEILTKKIYQNPDFYTNLYDKPINIARKGVAMQAIGLMQDRDMFKSELRMESMLSVLLELEIMKLQRDVQNRINPLRGEGPAAN